MLSYLCYRIVSAFSLATIAERARSRFSDWGLRRTLTEAFPAAYTRQLIQWTAEGSLKRDDSA